MGMDDYLNDEDKKKLKGYTEYLDNYDPKEAGRQYFENLRNDKSKAVDIASRSPFAEKSPEEEQFVQEHLDPMTQGLIGGGVMGSINRTAGTNIVKPVFNRLQQMMQIGSVKAPVASTAEALQLQKALEQAGEVLPKKFGSVIRKY